MTRRDTVGGVGAYDIITRRAFLRVGGFAAACGVTKAACSPALRAAPGSDRACIHLFLLGGPSQLDTWDPKPGAPAEIRGPFRPIRTSVPGIILSEHFPRMASRANRFAIIRSVYHDEAPIHETGHQLMQTGRLSRGGVEWPHYGAVVSKLRPTHGVVPWVLLPTPIVDTGVGISHGQGAGGLGTRYEPFLYRPAPGALRIADRAGPGRPTPLHRGDSQSRSAPGAVPHRLGDEIEVRAGDRETSLANRFRWPNGDGRPESPACVSDMEEVQDLRNARAFDLSAEPATVRERYGNTAFGRSCLLARRLVQHGVRFVTVNMFDTVFHRVTWDCHSNGADLNSTLDDYRDTLCPTFDLAFTALLEDLADCGRLQDTLVLAFGEFGRTPRLNARNGRDHWPGVWSILAAGGGVQGGRVVGASDRHGETPHDRPVTPAEIAATVYHSFGIHPATPLPGPGGSLPLADAGPIEELF